METGINRVEDKMNVYKTARSRFTFVADSYCCDCVMESSANRRGAFAVDREMIRHRQLHYFMSALNSSCFTYSRLPISLS